jgi:hypothetical protein
VKLIIDTDGTLKGTSVEVKMQADEIPQMIARAFGHKEEELPKRVARHRTPRTREYIVPTPYYQYGEN